MEKYVQQLVDDLREAATKVHEPDPLWHVDGSEELEGFEDVERFLHGPLEKLSAIVGIESVVFPPAERLTEGQQATLFSEMEALLAAYFFVPDFPDGLPITLRYRLLRTHWDDEYVFMGAGAGESHIEFCAYVVQECPFPPEFCECRRLDEEENGGMEAWESGGNDELPF